MMKKVITILALILFTGAASLVNAQDVITKRDGSEIRAKVTEVGVSDVKYKVYGEESGPTYTLPKSQIFMIQYQGGGKDVFSTETAPVQTPQQTQAPGTAVGGSQPKGYVPPAEIEYRKIEYGIKVGMNSAQEYTDDGSTDTRVGLHAGFFAEIFISKRLGLQPELQYSMQGGKDNSGTDKFDYINLPIMLKIYVIKRDFSIDVGLQPGYMMSAKISNYGDISDLIDNKFDLAIGVGASYKFANRFRVGLRYNFGTTKFVEELENRNRVSQLFVGVRF